VRELKNQSEIRFFLPILFTTMVFSLSFLDPINWPKNIALFTIIPFLLSSVLVGLKKPIIVKLRLPLVIILIAIVCNLISATNIQGDLVSTLIGVFGRNNGLLTTIALYLICLASVFFAARGARPIEILRVLSVGFIPSSFYGILQKVNLDPITWSKQNEVFSFFGNSNFASAILAMSSMCSLALVTFFWGSLSNPWRMIVSISLILGVYTTYLTESLQGLLGIAIAISLFALVLILKKSRILGYLYAFVMIIGAFIVLSGFLGLGILGTRIEQYTLSLRLKYWSAGWLMGLDNLPFGVGFDNYGDYFQKFRPDGAILVTGADLTTNNAHNPFLQTFATVGIFGVIPLIIIFIYTIYLAINSIFSRKNELGEKSISIVFVSIWAMTFFSIDNIAVALINWTFLGLVIGFAVPKVVEESSELAQNFKQKRISNSGLGTAQTHRLVGSLLSILLLILSWTASWPNREIAKVLQNPPQNQSELQQVRENLKRVSESKLTREMELKWLSDGYLAYGTQDEAIQILERGVQRFPRDMSLRDNLSFQYERTGLFEQAVKSREMQLLIERRNWRVYYFLGLDLIELDRYSELSGLISQINSLTRFMNESELDEWNRVRKEWQELAK
jgi:tetratricopeptide (TPR) repeat protein